MYSNRKILWKCSDKIKCETLIKTYFASAQIQISAQYKFMSNNGAYVEISRLSNDYVYIEREENLALHNR